jgi:group II intron reverse transcriptase/maturase
MMDTNVDGKVQRIQAMLYVKASQEPETRFRRLYKYLTRQEWVEAAMAKILRNRGSRTAGIDGKTRNHYRDETDRAKLAKEIISELEAGTYKPSPVRRTYIPKANGKKRPLGIPTIKDRVVQMVVKMVLEPIYEATFLSCSYGFRPNRCTWDALAEAYHYLQPFSQYYTVIEGDIVNCFGMINHGALMQQLKRRVLDKQLLGLIWSMLKAGFIEDLQYFETQEGTPQGGIVSPLLANVYMHRLDEFMYERFHNITPEKRYQRRKRGELISVRYIRYADDFIVMMRDGERAEELKKELADFIGQELKMTLSEEKTHITHAKDGFDFLGVRTFIGPKRSNPQKVLPYQVPAEKSVKSYRQKVNDLTHPDLDYLPPGERIKTINWLIVGWANYHRWGNAKETFSALNYWTIKKVHTMLRRYTPKGKKTTYEMYFRPVSECTNLRKWKKYTQWLTPSVEIPGNTRLGILPMSIISTGEYWKIRRDKIPPAFRLLDDREAWQERETGFYTDLEAVENAEIGQASRWYEGKYSLMYFINRESVFRRDHYTCTVCGCKSQRQKGEVHDLEIHHIDPEGGYEEGNLQTVCLDCHRRLKETKRKG